ncbi:MAG: hypothetical protein AAFR26_22765 [Cyanobacteria bacterium J06626_4]
MDRTLLLLLIVSGLLITVLAPHATLTLMAIVALSVLTIRVFWAIVQSFEEAPRSRRAAD